MKHVVLRLKKCSLVTEYLHLSGSCFEWKTEQAGRHEFDDQEHAAAAASMHAGIAVPVSPPADKPEHPRHTPHVAHSEPEPRDWLTEWESRHDQ